MVHEFTITVHCVPCKLFVALNSEHAECEILYIDL